MLILKTREGKIDLIELSHRGEVIEIKTEEEQGEFSHSSFDNLTEVDDDVEDEDDENLSESVLADKDG